MHGIKNTDSEQQGQHGLEGFVPTRRTFRPHRNRRYGLPASDFPPSRLVKFSPKHQYSRLLNFPYPGANFQPRMNTIVIEVHGISRLNDPSKPDSAAAFGVFFGPTCARNASFMLSTHLKQTANRALLEAVRYTLNNVIQMRHTNFIPGWKELIIMTNSDYAKKSLSNWVWQWEKNGWRRTGGKELIENIEIMQDLHNLMSYMEHSLDMSVRFWKVDREELDGANGLARKALGSANRV